MGEVVKWSKLGRSIGGAGHTSISYTERINNEKKEKLWKLELLAGNQRGQKEFMIILTAHMLLYSAHELAIQLAISFPVMSIMAWRHSKV